MTNECLKLRFGKSRDKTRGATSICNRICWGGYYGEYTEKEENPCRDEALKIIIIQRVKKKKKKRRESQKESK